MIKIITVCGMGLGSGLLLRMSAERVLKRHGIQESDIDIEVADIGTAQRQDVDIFITTPEFAPRCRKWAKRLVVIKNVLDDKEMERALMPVFNEVAASKRKQRPPNVERVLTSAFKILLGVTIMHCGAAVIAAVLTPMSKVITQAFHLQAVVPVNEAITALAATKFSAQIIFTMLGALVVNIILARFTPLRYIFLTGHHILFIAAVCTIMLSTSHLSSIQVLVYGAIISGIVITTMPAFSMPLMHKATKGAGFALGHLATMGYCVAGLIGKFVGGDPQKTDSEKMGLSSSLGFFREALLLMGLAVTVVCLLAVFCTGSIRVAGVYARTWESITWALGQGLTFAAGVAIILLGMRTFIGEIVPLFRSISDKIVPNAIPALDCPAVFPYGPNSVFIGFLGYTIGMFIMIVILWVIKYPITVIPMLFHSFFMGGTAGVIGNATGGRRGAFLGAGFQGLLNSFLQAFLVTLMANSGFSGTTFADTDYCVTGIIIGNLSGLMPLVLAAFVVMLAIAILVEVKITRPMLAEKPE
ncbi:MAG: PTS ascorbate transporter subunit IIC [Chloroflexi bacterium]|nr:PTS ascorbate transporter subunit IIC [Chloroflexota bacterium]